MAQEFVPSLGDVPLAPQLTIDADSAVSFETADGRIAEISGILQKTNQAQNLLRFYSETLPALGWHMLAPQAGDNDENLRLRFRRDKEILQIDIVKRDVTGRWVIFRLQPL